MLLRSIKEEGNNEKGRKRKGKGKRRYQRDGEVKVIEVIDEKCFICTS